MNRKKMCLFICLIFLLLPFRIFAEEYDETEDIEIFGLELEKLLNLGSGILAAVLFILTFFAFLRTKNNRLKYISIAFLIFAFKGLITSAELFSGEWLWVDPTASLLDFVILLTFFFGIMKR